MFWLLWNYFHGSTITRQASKTSEAVDRRREFIRGNNEQTHLKWLRKKEKKNIAKQRGLKKKSFVDWKAVSKGFLQQNGDKDQPTRHRNDDCGWRGADYSTWQDWTQVNPTIFKEHSRKRYRQNDFRISTRRKRLNISYLQKFAFSLELFWVLECSRYPNIVGCTNKCPQYRLTTDSIYWIIKAFYAHGILIFKENASSYLKRNNTNLFCITTVKSSQAAQLGDRELYD